MENDEGKICLDLVPKISDPKDGVSRTVVLLHGATGTSRNNYAEELAGAFAHAGIDVVFFNHFAPANCRNLRLLNMCENQPMDEVI